MKSTAAMSFNRKVESEEFEYPYSDQQLIAAAKTDNSSISQSLSVALTENNFIVRDRMAAALAKIASAHRPRIDGGFSKMSRDDMIDIARIACAVAGIRCTSASAWSGEKAPARYRSRPKKVKLHPRAPVMEAAE